MIKKCKGCPIEFDGPPNKKFHDPKCKKNYENSQRSAPKSKERNGDNPIYKPPSIPVDRPQTISNEAGIFWDELAPVLLKRGHLNILSKRILEIYCVLQAKIDDILKMIDIGTMDECVECGAKRIIPGNRSLLQLDDKWNNSTNTESQSFKESPYSMLLRQYTARSLDYAKQLYLTPLSNRGSFGLDEEPKEDSKKDGKDRFFK